MTNYCNNCGEKKYGICSNCHEELYILENQSEYIDFPLSDEFMGKATKQRQEIKNEK